MNVAPILYVIMGVSGSGKSTLAKALSEHLGFAFMEADDFHLPASIAKMASGVPLSEEDRGPWIKSMCDLLLKEQQDTVLAYSGLKKAHRFCFRHIGYKTHFIYLQGSFHSLKARLRMRHNHFMPDSLLESQLHAMEHPDRESDITSINIDQYPDLDSTIALIKQNTFYHQQPEQNKEYE